MLIRQETKEDYSEVYLLVKDAFTTTSFSDGSEPDYLNHLRTKNSFIPELSLVAVENDVIVGQIVLYEFEFINDKGESKLYLDLSPLSVHVDYFKRGIGTALINEGCTRAKDLGYHAVFLCWDPAYYTKFGFDSTYKYGIYHIKDTEKQADWCMVKELIPGVLNSSTGFINIE